MIRIEQENFKYLKLLHIFAEHVVEIRPFINNNCLGLVFAALSSHEAGMRKLAFLALANLYTHIEGAHHLPEKSLLLAFLELLRNSLSKENQKLSCTISLFLARAVKIISDPGKGIFFRFLPCD